MADTFDPYDENDAFDAPSLNTRFSGLQDAVNAVPLRANQAGALGPMHIGSLLSNTRTQVKILTPRNAKEGEYQGDAYFCRDIKTGYPGYNVEDFETAMPQGLCWQRIADPTGGSGGVNPPEYLEVNTSGLVLGEGGFSALLIMANIELCATQYRVETDDGFGYWQHASASFCFATIISTISSTGVRTFHWETLRFTSTPQSFDPLGGGQTSGYCSLDIPYRVLLDTPGLDIQTVQVLGSIFFNGLAEHGQWLNRSLVRFCQLTAVALHAKVN